MKTSCVLPGCSCVVTLGIDLASREAHALGPVGIEVGAKVAGTDRGPSSEDDGRTTRSASALAGGRAGITIFGIYLGGTSSSTTWGAATGSAVATTRSSAGGEIGYSYENPVLTLRPQLGLGNITDLRLELEPISKLATRRQQLLPRAGRHGAPHLRILYFGADINCARHHERPAIGAGTSTSTDTVFTFDGQLG